MKTGKVKKWVAYIELICMMICLIAVNMQTVTAKEQKTYLAVGDSISTGYGLENKEESFVSGLASIIGYCLDDQAQDGETSNSLLTKITSGSLDESIENADIVTVTVGGNDMMNAVYEYLLKAYNKANPESPTTVEMMRQRLRAGEIQTVLFAAQNISGFPTSKEALRAAASFSRSFAQVIQIIREKNGNVAICVATQYHPYQWLATGNSLIDSEIAPIIAAVDAGVGILNQIITNGEGYEVADVYTVFKNSENVLTNAYLQYESPFSFSGNLDFHPNKEGHSVIAATFLSIMKNNFQKQTAGKRDQVKSESPKTGDNGSMAKAVVCMAAIAAVCVTKKKLK